MHAFALVPPQEAVLLCLAAAFLLLAGRASAIRALARWHYGIRLEHHGAGRFTYRNLLQVLGPAAMWQALVVDGIKNGLLFIWVTIQMSALLVDLEKSAMWILIFGLSAIAGWVSHALDAWKPTSEWLADDQPLDGPPRAGRSRRAWN